MNRRRMGFLALLLALAIGKTANLAAQGPAPPPPPVPELATTQFSDSAVLRVGQDYTLRAGNAVRELTVIFGNATIEGHVEGDVVVLLGKAELSPTAVVDGSFVVVGGNATAAAGARVDRDVVVVGGGFDAPAGFTPGGQHVVVGSALIGRRLDALVPWMTRGLLWGRPIVPDLVWIWWIVGGFFLVYLLLNLVFDHPVRACAATLAHKPLTTFMVGLLVLLLAGPVCALLAVSIIGIAVVPFVLCALAVGGIVGKVSTARWIGMSIARWEPELEQNRAQSLFAFTLGFGVITLAYMIPVLGFVTWALLGVFGLGAAALASIVAYRRENPAPPPRERSPELRQSPSTVMSPPTPDVGAGSPPSQENPAMARASATGADLASFPKAAFRDRLAAFVLDVFLVFFVYQALDIFRRDNTIFLLLLAYHIGFWTWKGATVGGIICQLRVVRADGAPLRFADALVRGLSGIFSLLVLGIGCLWMLRDPERQTWHDRIAGTYVVKVPRNWPL